LVPALDGAPEMGASHVGSKLDDLGRQFWRYVLRTDRLGRHDRRKRSEGTAAAAGLAAPGEADVIACSLDSDYRADTLDLADLSDGPYGFTTNPGFPIVYMAVLSEVAAPADDATEEALDDEHDA
jgi:hypothetical protein